MYRKLNLSWVSEIVVFKYRVILNQSPIYVCLDGLDFKVYIIIYNILYKFLSDVSLNIT